MSRGRNPTPPEIAVLKGNPRKKRVRRKAAPAAPPSASPLAAEPAPSPMDGEVLPPPRTDTPQSDAPNGAVAEFVYPEFLTQARERAIFKLIVDEFLPRNLVRVTDFNAVGRYAVYMHKWIDAKEQLEASGGSNWYKSKSKHGELLRRHPAFQDMLDLGHELRQSEPQLALTPLSRNAIMVRFMRGGASPDMFAPPEGDAARPRQDELPTAPAPTTALGMLRRSATPIDKLN